MSPRAMSTYRRASRAYSDDALPPNAETKSRAKDEARDIRQVLLVMAWKQVQAI